MTSVAAEAGLTVEHVDPSTGRLRVAGVGEVDLSVALARAAGKTEPQQRAILAGALRRSVEAAAPLTLPPAYDGLDAATRARLADRLAEERRFPHAPRPQELLGRLERHHRIDGWQARLRSAAAAYERDARGDAAPRALPLVLAANLHRLAGDGQRAAALADEALTLLPLPADRSDGPAVDAHCAALLVGGRRAELAALAALGQPVLGPRWWPVCTAARAAEVGDVESLGREAEAAERLAAAEDVDTSGMLPADRDLAEVLAAWRHERT